MKVSCSHCQHFIPDQIGSGDGIGACKPYNEYKAKGASESALRRARINLGNDPDNSLFWGGSARTRKCKKYERR